MTIGLLVMAYGTPNKEEDLEAYYTHIRHGRRPSEEHLQDLKERYKAIGGISPLAKLTTLQAEGLADQLNEMQTDVEFKLYIGLKHIDPFIEDVVKQMYEDGITEVVSIVLAPHFSTFSVQSYNNRAKEEANKLGINITSVEDWYSEPKFIAYWTEAINKVVDAMSEIERENAAIIFSAHSLPEKIIALGDPYPKQLQETADLIAKQTKVKNYFLGWQSAGKTPEPWLGPDVQNLTRELYEEKGFTSFIYAPVGFVCDHLEVLFDNDVECKVVTNDLGVSYYRPEMPNVNKKFIAAMADAVWKQL